MEAYLLLSQDRLVLSLVITLPPLLLTASIFESQGYEMQRLMHVGTSIRWILKKVRNAVISILLWTILCALLILGMGYLYKLTFETTWENTYTFSNTVSTIDSISKNAYPFEYALFSNLSITSLLFIQMLLLFVRGVFYSMIMMVVSMSTNVPALGFSIALIYTWLDVNWYKLFGSNAINLAPCFQSIVASINSAAPNWIYIASYWLTSLVLFTLILTIFADNFAENMVLANSKQI